MNEDYVILASSASFFLAFPFTFYQSMACGRLLPHERAAPAVESSLGRRQWVCCLCRGFLLGNIFVYAVEEEEEVCLLGKC